MNLTLHQLNIFEAVARNLSYTGAAKALHLSQPAVSMQIRQLEAMFGLDLFEKLGKKIQLSEAGQELFNYSQVIIRQLQEAEEVLDSLKGLNSGRLQVAVASTAKYFAPRLMAAFNHRYPGIRLQLDVTDRDILVRQLEANEVDLVLMGQPPGNLDVESEPFLDNPLLVIAPPDHPLVGERNIPLKRLKREVFVLREPGSGTRQATEHFFTRHRMVLNCSMVITRNEAIKQAVRSGLGLSVVSAHTIELELETGRLAVLDVDDFPITRKWFLVHHKAKRLTPATQAFRNFVLSEAGNL